MAGARIPGLIAHSPGANPPGYMQNARRSPLTAGADQNDGGVYFVTGTVAIDSTPDIPVHRKVRLFAARSGRLVRETWSDPVTGEYRFERIRIGPWLVVAHDYTNSYNAVVADNILAVPM